MSTLHYRYPPAPEAAGKLTSRLTLRNWRSASTIRRHPELGLLRLFVVGMRYWDRGRGGFMGGGDWVYEGRVVCESYPASPDLDPDRVPEIRSKAGWGFSGTIRNPDGESLRVADRRHTRPEAADYEAEFWSIEAALDYANGEDGGAVGKDTSPTRITWTKRGYRIRHVETD